jgi:hypothetical protein
MRISTTHISSMVLRPKHVEIRYVVTVKTRKKPKNSVMNWSHIHQMTELFISKIILCLEINLQNFISFSWQINSYLYAQASIEALCFWTVETLRDFGSYTGFTFFSDFQLFRPEYHWRDLSSRNAHLVHQNWYRISFTFTVHQQRTWSRV